MPGEIVGEEERNRQLTQKLAEVDKHIRQVSKGKRLDRAAEIGGATTGGVEILASLPKITFPEALIILSAITIGVVSFWRFRKNDSEEDRLRKIQKGLSRRLHPIVRIVSPPWRQTPG